MEIGQVLRHREPKTTAIYVKKVGTDAKNRMLAAALGCAFDADPASGTAR